MSYNQLEKADGIFKNCTCTFLVMSLNCLNGNRNIIKSISKIEKVIENGVIKMKIGFIGAGKVGFSLGKLFSENGVTLTGFHSRHEDTAKEAADFTNSLCFKSMKELIDASDAVFITTTDGAINSVYEQLKEMDITGKYIAHCSGSIAASEAFPNIEKYNAYCFSLHPLYPVSDKYMSYKGLRDAFFCLEGDKEPVEHFKKLLSGIGLKVRLIAPSDKIKYHAGCAIASNLVCALIGTSAKLLNECGFEKDEAIVALEPLIRANIDSILSNGVQKALTGPLERGDTKTITKHIKALSGNERDMYISVSRQLLTIARLKNPDRNYDEISRLLNE